MLGGIDCIDYTLRLYIGPRDGLSLFRHTTHMSAIQQFKPGAFGPRRWRRLAAGGRVAGLAGWLALLGLSIVSPQQSVNISTWSGLYECGVHGKPSPSTCSCAMAAPQKQRQGVGIDWDFKYGVPWFSSFFFPLEKTPINMILLAWMNTTCRHVTHGLSKGF